MRRLVVVGNEFLATFARQYHHHVTVIPTAVDTSRFVPRPARASEPRELTVGWIGSPTTFPYLQSLAPQLQQAGRRTMVVARAEVRRHGFVEEDTSGDAAESRAERSVRRGGRCEPERVRGGASKPHQRLPIIRRPAAVRLSSCTRTRHASSSPRA